MLLYIKLSLSLLVGQVQILLRVLIRRLTYKVLKLYLRTKSNYELKTTNIEMCLSSLRSSKLSGLSK